MILFMVSFWALGRARRIAAAVEPKVYQPGEFPAPHDGAGYFNNAGRTSFAGWGFAQI
jgi:hypothetical protein